VTAVLSQDLRLTFRTLRRKPAFLAISVVSLALGIGVNISVVSYINALFLRPLPGVPESGSLISVYHRAAAGQFNSLAYPDYEYFRDHTHAFSGMLAYVRVPVMLRIDAVAERVFGELVSNNFFSVLESKLLAGRGFAPTEDAPVVILSHKVWTSRFGGDPGVIGRSIRLGNGLFTIIGVAPRDFRGIVLDSDEPPSLWLPIATFREAVPPLRDFDIMGSWGMQSFEVVGRLSPNVTPRQALDDLAALSARIDIDHPERAQAWSEEPPENRRLAPVLLPSNRTRFWPGDRGIVLGFLGLLGTVAVLILLIACFNVAHLILAQAAIRQTEFAIRLSLGSSRGRIIRQLLTENLVLAGFGGLAGLLVAAWTTRFLAGFHHAFRLPLDVDSGVDPRVLAFALLLSLCAGAGLALFPARIASSSDLSSVLKSDSGTAGLHRLRINRYLVVGQISLSLVLLQGAGLFSKTLRNAQAVDVTVRSENVLLANLDVASRGYDDARGGELYSRIIERLRGLPGVRDAALVFVVPLGGQRGGTNVVITDQTGSPAKPVQVGFNVVTPGYFRTIGIPALRGRDFNDGDRRGSAAVAVINEEMGRRLFPGREPVGRQFLLKWKPEAMVEVVGVVRDGRFRNYRSAPEPTIYVPLAQRYQPEMNLEVRTVGNPVELAGAIQREVAVLDKDLPLTDIQTLKTHFDQALSQERLSAVLLTGLSSLALVLAAIGIYGVLSHSVSQRTREIGVRVALGADPGDVLRHVVGGMMRPVAMGLVVGGAVALALTTLIRHLLFGLSPTDPFVFGGTVLIMLAVAALAAYVPARRAARLNPTAALRHQ
jgi:predicted permease